MKKLHCDIHLNGSTKQWLTWHKANNTKEDFIKCVQSSLGFRAKTVPLRMSRRMGCLIGIVYDEIPKEEREYYLDVIITAFQGLDQEINN